MPETASQLALRIRNLRKAYKEVIAVDGLELEVRTGECFGLLGPNGAGKTTTVEICEGLTDPDSGEVEVLGQRWTSNAAQLCDRVAIMDHGKEIALGTPRELIAVNCAEQMVEFVAGAAAKTLDMSALRRIAGVRDVRTENGAVRLQVTELHTAVPALLAELTRQNVPLTELRTHSATLEDVFVTLTGRHLRDE
jgi:ABC-type multidrug transport system ATPase subunit